MAITTEVVTKRMSGDSLVIVIRFTDNSDGSSFEKAYVYRGVCNTRCVERDIYDQLQVLLNLKAYADSLPIGPVVPEAPPITPPPPDPNITLFRSRCRSLEMAKVLIDLNIIQTDNAKVVALGNWIKNNFETYVDYL